MIIYKNVKFRFDTSLWAAFCKVTTDKHGISEVSEMIGVDEVTMLGWIKERYKEDFKHPSMNKFLNLCGLMDVDPGQFFTIRDE